MKIALSELDAQRFGATTAKVLVEAGDRIDDITKWCTSRQVGLLIARCPTNELALVQEMETKGFYLTDTLVHYRTKDMARCAALMREPYYSRIATNRDANSVERMAREIFHGYSGHYHTDPRLNKGDADLVYSSWARALCERHDSNGVVFLACAGHDDECAGFLATSVTHSLTCEIVLNGVCGRHQRKGLYASMIAIAKNWAIDNGMEAVRISTKLTNIAVQKVWCRLGFEPFDSYYTFHKWFDDDPF
jgi:hypothetical protein